MSLKRPVDSPNSRPAKTANTSPIRESIFAIDEKTTQSKTYSSAPVFPHVVIDNLLTPDSFTRLREEVFNQLRFVFKETDLFKLYQSIDLANLDLDKYSDLVELKAFREAITSKRFRDMVSEITGCGPLTDRVDCAVNNYAQGSHLLCHDDVIGSRKISYIVYMTDDSEEWKPEYGGSLELYDQNNGVIDCHPSAKILPSPNTMGIFEVVPGVSLHSVQEVFTADRPRISIQGWFHSADAPAGTDQATLGQLQAMISEQGAAIVDTVSGELTREDKESLASWVNPMYLRKNIIKQVASKFGDDCSIVLNNFVNTEAADALLTSMEKLDSSDNLGSNQVPSYEVGVDNEWVAGGPPHMQRFLEFRNDVPTTPSVGNELNRYATLMKGDAFAKLINQLTGLEVSRGASSLVRRFRPGLDYTVAHYGLITKTPKLDATLCFVNGAENWEDGEAGGFQCYIEADNDETTEAAESYQWDDDTVEEEGSKLLSVAPQANALTLVLRDEGVMNFVKYVSATAQGSRFDVAMVYNLDPAYFAESDSQEL